MQELSTTVSEDKQEHAKKAAADLLLSEEKNKKRQSKGIQLLSTQRGFIMGIAILWVMWFHTDWESSNPFFAFIRQIGYGGVDIFFLLSGIGAYFSYSKKPDTVAYLKHRAKRILVPYYPFIFVWLLMMKWTGELYGIEIIGNLTMTGWWCGARNQFNWYTNAVWLFYLSAPLFVGIMVQAKNAGQRFFKMLLLSAAGFIVSVSFWHTLLLTAFSRIPLFIVGIWLGAEIKSKNTLQDNVSGSKKKISGFYKKLHSLTFWNICLIIGLGMLYLCLTKLSGYLWHYGLWWYPFLLIAPGLAMDIGAIAKRMEVHAIGRYLWRGITAIGDASFEIFLWHIGIFEFIKPRLKMDAAKWLLLFTLTIVFSIAYRKLMQKITEKLLILRRKNEI